MSKIRLAINGFGRIGKQAFKIALEKKELEVVAINDPGGSMVASHLLKFDSNYGRYKKDVSYTENALIVDGKEYPVLAEREPGLLPWAKYKVDVVLECTGRFTSGEKSMAHITAGAKKVVISAPAKDEGLTPTLVLGVNEHDYTGQQVVSNASCTTNCIAPVISVLHKAFGIEKAMMSTIHGYTAEQNLVDGSPPGGKANDLRRARAAAINIIPTTTGAAVSATQAIPDLKGRFHGVAFRVPVSVGSLSDFVMLLKKNVTKEEVNQAFMDASKRPEFKGILELSNEQLVSTDIIGDPASCIVDLSLTQVVDGNLVKVVAWYDNEFGYSNRLVEMAIMVGKN